MTPETRARLACGGPIHVRITVTSDGADVVDLSAKVLYVEGRDRRTCWPRTDDGHQIRIPLEPAEPANLSLPRPPLRGAR